MMTLAVTGAPDSHRGPVFLAGPDGQRNLLTALACFFCQFPQSFRDFCEGFGCFRWSFGPSGPSARGDPKPQGGIPSAPLAAPLPAVPPPTAQGPLL